MKTRVTLVTIMSILLGSLFASPITINNLGNSARLIDSSEFGLRMQTTLGNFETSIISADPGDFTLLTAQGYAWSVDPGQPRLPVMRKIIAVPLGAQVSARIESRTEQIVDLAAQGYSTPVAPAQPSLSKSVDPADAPFVINEAVYASEAWVGDSGVSVEELGVLRGQRLFVLTIRPVEYNPARHELRVWTNLTIDVDFSGSDLAATRELRARTWSPVFEGSLSNAVFNYLPLNERDTVTDYPLSMILITEEDYIPTLQPFIDWKEQCGVTMYIGLTDEIGSSVSAIESYIESIWDDATPANPAPSYVLFVGDTGQIPAHNGNTGSHVTDVHYVCLEGNDYMPEMLFGRFSANNVSELEPQVEKTLMYEQYSMPDPSYLQEVVMIAGMDSYHGGTWGNGQINYGVGNYFNTDHGITSYTYFYPNSGSNSANIINDISNGVGYANYTAHGGQASWSDPSFTIPNINSLQNYGEYPFVVGNCCLTNKFEVNECFGEAWLRAEDKGAIGYIGGTNSTYWDEDFWWGVGAGAVTANPTYAGTGLGVYDGLFHENDEPFADWATTAGAMILRGNLAVVEGGGDANYYWEIYALMGDPSLSPYIGLPTENDADWPQQILIGLTSIDVSADPYSYVALNFDGECKAVGLADEFGDVTLEFEPFNTPGEAEIVITAQNRIPVIETIGVIPNDGPYVVVDDFAVSGEDNGMAEYGESFTLDVDVTNVGSDPAYSVVMTISSEDPFLTLDNTTVNIGELTAETTVTVEDAFSLTLGEDVPDQRPVHLVFAFAGENGAGEDVSWVSEGDVIANAPELSVGMYFIDDSAGNNDGVVDPGEEVIVHVPVSNSGHAASPDATANLVCNHQWITIEENSLDLGELDIAAQITASYTLTASETAENGTLIPAGFHTFAGSHSGSQVFNLPIGVVAEDFENGLSAYGWAMSGDADWFLEDGEVWEGDYALQSGDVGDYDSSIAEVTLDVAADGVISFYYKVSSEPDYDYLRFFIDGQELGSWAGVIDWTFAEYDVDAGQHTFKWEYEKDQSQSHNSDCAWIDFIQLPFFGGESAPIAFLPNSALDFGEVEVGETATLPFTISNYGAEILTGTFTTTDGFIIASGVMADNGGRNSRHVATRDEYTFSIPPMSEQEISIVFSPTAEMSYNTQFTIDTNDPLAEDMVVEVTANAIVGLGDPAPQYTTELGGNYPNPFNPETTVSFSLAEPQRVTIDIYNVLGQRVSRLVDDQYAAGEHTATWRGRDSRGESVGSGVYFCKMESSNGGGRYTSVKKMILLK